MAYRLISLRAELSVQDIFVVANKTSINQQRLEDRLSEERGQDRRIQDQFCAQVLTQLENIQLQSGETEHHLIDVEGKPEAPVDGPLKTLQANEHDSSVAWTQSSLAAQVNGFLSSDIASDEVGDWSSIGVRADLRNTSECSRNCRCSCHIRRRLNTPRLLDGFLGTLFIGYTGSPLLSQKCDQLSCRGRKETSTSVTYHFPRWFVISRMVQLRAKITAMYGPEVSLRFNRVVDGKALVFHYATTGDISKMKQLFVQGRASPSDVRFDSGWTPLHVSILEGLDLGPSIELMLSVRTE